MEIGHGAKVNTDFRTDEEEETISLSLLCTIPKLEKEGKLRKSQAGKGPSDLKHETDRVDPRTQMEEMKEGAQEIKTKIEGRELGLLLKESVRKCNQELPTETAARQSESKKEGTLGRATQNTQT